MEPRAATWLLLAAVLWGSTGTAQAVGGAEGSPLAVGTIRLLIGSVGLLALAGRHIRRPPPAWLALGAAAMAATTINKSMSSMRSSHRVTPARQAAGMIADPTGEVTNNFEVMRPGQGLADRGTFLIDPDGVIQFMEITAEGIGRNAVELLRKVRAAQYVREHPNEVCPAKWEEGDDTLAPSLDLVGKI